MGICIVRMQDLGKGHGVSRCSPTLKLCEPIHLGFLGEASLHRHDWWNHWPLMIELSFQCLSLPQRSWGWGGMDSSNLSIMPATRPHPCNQHPSLRTFWKSPHYHQLRCDRKGLARSSLLAQWLGTLLSVKEMWVWSLVWEDPVSYGATQPAGRNYWAQAPQQEKPPQWGARGPHRESRLCLLQLGESPHSRKHAHSQK